MAMGEARRLHHALQRTKEVEDMVGQLGLEDIMLTCNTLCNARCKNPISESRVFFLAYGAHVGSVTTFHQRDEAKLREI